MLTVDLKINGDLIGHMYIVNIDGFETCTYEYTVYDVARRKTTTNTVQHKRSKGAWDLVQKIVKHWNKEQAK